jgi:endo-1,3(4)-beta-glucanase
VYGYGKELMKVAMLTAISWKNGGGGWKTGMGEVKGALRDLLEGGKLVYDEIVGGVITMDGVLDQGKDFGNGWYNDHHYHYGYVIQAAAIASMIPEGGDELTSSLGSLIDSLWYDVCSNLPGGPDFPVSRHFSVYHGHSFASGLFPQGDGKSQESWSEAYNCYGACRRWARRRGDGRGEEWSGIMMRMER